MSNQNREVVVTLVTTPDQARKDFPEQMRGRVAQGVISCPYTIIIGPDGLDPAKNKFAAWLAENIGTTQFDDDASRLVLIHARTNGQKVLRSLIEGAESRAYLSGFDAALTALGEEIEKARRQYAVFGPSGYDEVLVSDYQWPVFGGHSVRGAATPEQYFEACARMIRASGAVPLAAGLRGMRPEPSLLRTFANGRGLDLVGRYEREVAAQRASAADGSGLSYFEISYIDTTTGDTIRREFLQAESIEHACDGLLGVFDEVQKVDGLPTASTADGNVWVSELSTEQTRYYKSEGLIP